MGIIQNQTLKGSLFSYLGVAIGYINVVVLMPQFFTTDQVGLTQLLLSISAIFSLFGTLGFNGVSGRLFPYFRNSKNCHNGFPALLMFTFILGFLIILIAFFVLKPHITESNIEKSPLFVEYLFILVPLIFFRLLFSLLDGYNKVLYDAVTGTFWVDFGYKLLNFIFILFYITGIVNFRQYMFGFTFAISFPAIPVLYVLIRKNNFNLTPHFSFIDKLLLNQILSVAFYSILGASSGIIVTSIDRIMVNEYLSLSATGIFSICALFGTVIKIPSASMNKISTPILAEAWKGNDIKKIDKVYKQSTINQLIFATLIFIGILGNMNNILRVLPSEYAEGKYVIIIYSFAFMIMVSGGLGSFILGTSPKYKVQTYFMLFTAILTVISNMIFIPLMGMNGAAIATLITYLISTGFRVFYLKYKMNLFPYNIKHLQTLLIGIISLVPVYFFGDFNSLILDIVLKSGVITIIFVVLILTFNISEEVTLIFNNYKGKFNKYLRN